MTILVDMDDTMEQLLKRWVARANEKYGQDITLDQITSWDVSEPYPGLNKKEIYSVTYEPGFWSGVEPMPGAAEALKHFMDEGHEVYVVTATEPEHLEEKMKGLLFRYFPFITWDRVIVTGRKQMIRGGRSCSPRPTTGPMMRKRTAWSGRTPGTRWSGLLTE